MPTHGLNPEDFLITEKPKAVSALSHQVGGSHYVELLIQPAEYCVANRIPKLEGDVIAYVTRWRDKGGITDLCKAIHSIELLIELSEKYNPATNDPEA
jgi:hypothetical protein